MDENKLNIETVDGHNELVVSFLSRMVSLSDEEKQTVLSCLPDTGKQTITQLYEALRSQGHRGSCRESRTIPPAGGVWADLR